MKLRDLLKLIVPSLATNDNAAIAAALDNDVAQSAAPSQQQTNDSAVLAALHTLTQRLDTMDAEIKKLATKDEEEETEEERKKREAEEAAKKSEDEAAEELKKQEETGDTVLEAEGPGAVVNLGSVYTGDSASGGALDVLKEVSARAEILAPGIAIPTKDSLKGNKGAALATFMRTALEKCATTDSGKDAIGTFLGGRKIGDLKGHALLGVFNGAANLVSARNNRATTSVTQSSVRTGDFSKPSSITSINEANRKFWANGGKP